MALLLGINEGKMVEKLSESNQLVPEKYGYNVVSSYSTNRMTLRDLVSLVISYLISVAYFI